MKKMPEHSKLLLSKLNKGKKRTDETKKRMSESRKGIKFTEEQCNKISKAKKGHSCYNDERNNKIGKSQKGISKPLLKVPCIQYDLEGNFIKEHNSMSEAAKSLNLKHCNGIEACCRGILKTSSGFIWKRK